MDAKTKADGIRAGEVVPGFTSDRPVEWSMRPAEPADVEAIAELRAMVMRPDLERLGRFDEHRVRQRLRDSFSPRHTSVILAGGAFAGCVTVRPARTGSGWSISISPLVSRAGGSVRPSCARCWTGPMPTACPSA